MTDPVTGTTADRAHNSRPQVGAILFMLLLSAMAILLSPPLLMPAGYSWVSHSVSESAAQALPGAWLTRTGFLLWGFGVLWLAFLARNRWGRWGSAALGAWGVLMVAAAVYSHAPWQSGVPSDAFEDFLHSVAASGMGPTMIAGVLVVSAHRSRSHPLTRVYDGVIAASAVALPLGAANAPGLGGALQRALFVLAYGWFGLEALRTIGGRRVPSRAEPEQETD